VLELAPPQAEVLYWLAYLESLRPGASASAWTPALQRAEAASPRLVFPFRAESAEVFEWAGRQVDSWRPKYYLALVLWSRNETARARDLLERCGSAPDFAPFYAVRAKALDATAHDRSLADLRRASELDPKEWRYGKLLAERHLEDRAYDKALEVASRYYKQSPGSYVLGMLFAKTLLRAGRVADAAAMLARVNVLPYEGSTEGRLLYREAQLLLGAEAFKAGRTAEAARRVAAAREWPENLGAGKPYREDADERLEDWLEAKCLDKLGRGAEAARLRDQVSRFAGAAPASRAAWPEGATRDESRILAAWD
jgi:hypothetical protein